MPQGRMAYLSANWTNPHRLPTGILTWTNSPYWLKTCLKWSSETLESKPPTNIWNAKCRVTKKLKSKMYLPDLKQKDTHSCIIWVTLVLSSLRILIWSCKWTRRVKTKRKWMLKIWCFLCRVKVNKMNTQSGLLLELLRHQSTTKSLKTPKKNTRMLAHPKFHICACAIFSLFQLRQLFSLKYCKTKYLHIHKFTKK